jgi:hypothetical protein
MESQTEQMNRLENEISGIGASLCDLIQGLGHRNKSLMPLGRPNIGLSVSNPESEGSHAPCEFINPIPEWNLNLAHRSDTQHLKLATPNDFWGDRTKGQAFLNSCELYQALVPSPEWNPNLMHRSDMQHLPLATPNDF